MADETPATPTPAPVPDGTPPARPEDEQRLPATVPPAQLTADRFTAAPPLRATASP